MYKNRHQFLPFLLFKNWKGQPCIQRQDVWSRLPRIEKLRYSSCHWKWRYRFWKKGGRIVNFSKPNHNSNFQISLINWQPLLLQDLHWVKNHLYTPERRQCILIFLWTRDLNWFNPFLVVGMDFALLSKEVHPLARKITRWAWNLSFWVFAWAHKAKRTRCVIQACTNTSFIERMLCESHCCFLEWRNWRSHRSSHNWCKS